MSFESVLAEMRAMHNRKAADYGRDADPFANIRDSERFGVPGWLGAVIRANDKINRVAAHAEHGKLENESLRDSLLDASVYFGIAVCLLDEETKESADRGDAGVAEPDRSADEKFKNGTPSRDPRFALGAAPGSFGSNPVRIESHFGGAVMTVTGGDE